MEGIYTGEYVVKYGAGVMRYGGEGGYIGMGAAKFANLGWEEVCEFMYQKVYCVILMEVQGMPSCTAPRRVGVKCCMIMC